jgi:hypothetical protein
VYPIHKYAGIRWSRDKGGIMQLLKETTHAFHEIEPFVIDESFLVYQMHNIHRGVRNDTLVLQAYKDTEGKVCFQITDINGRVITKSHGLKLTVAKLMEGVE